MAQTRTTTEITQNTPSTGQDAPRTITSTVPSVIPPVSSTPVVGTGSTPIKTGTGTIPGPNITGPIKGGPGIKDPKTIEPSTPYTVVNTSYTSSDVCFYPVPPVEVIPVQTIIGTFYCTPSAPTIIAGESTNVVLTWTSTNANAGEIRYNRIKQPVLANGTYTATISDSTIFELVLFNTTSTITKKLIVVANITSPVFIQPPPDTTNPTHETVVEQEPDPIPETFGWRPFSDEELNASSTPVPFERPDSIGVSDHDSLVPGTIQYIEYKAAIKSINSNRCKKLDPKTDIYFSSYDVSYSDKVFSNEPSITSFLTHSLSTNFVYAYSAAQNLFNHTIISSIPLCLTSDGLSFIKAFRSITSESDILSDSRLHLGKIGVIELKKYVYGDRIKPGTLTASTTSGVVFVDTCSANDDYGILTMKSNGLSAGILFYDLGLAYVFGPSLTAINSLSSLSSVEYSSKYKMTTWTAFCSADPLELNYTTNENAFYNYDVVSNPEETTSFSTVELLRNPGCESTLDFCDSTGITLDTSVFRSGAASQLVTVSGGGFQEGYVYTKQAENVSSMIIGQRYHASAWCTINIGGFQISKPDGSSVQCVTGDYSRVETVNLTDWYYYETSFVCTNNDLSQCFYYGINGDPGDAGNIDDLSLKPSTTGMQNGYQWGNLSIEYPHSNFYLNGLVNKTPYITTIGFYNDDNDLLLVAKLGQPVRKPKTIPISFKVSYDF